MELPPERGERGGINTPVPCLRMHKTTLPFIPDCSRNSLQHQTELVQIPKFGGYLTLLFLPSRADDIKTPRQF